jgi:hypothetical protein
MKGVKGGGAQGCWINSFHQADFLCEGIIFRPYFFKRLAALFEESPLLMSVEKLDKTCFSLRDAISYKLVASDLFILMLNVVELKKRKSDYNFLENRLLK